MKTGLILVLSFLTLGVTATASAQTVSVFDTVYTPSGYRDGPGTRDDARSGNRKRAGSDSCPRCVGDAFGRAHLVRHACFVRLRHNVHRIPESR